MRIGSSTIAMMSEHTLKKNEFSQRVSVTGRSGEQVSLDPTNKEKSLFQQMKEAATVKDNLQTETPEVTRGTITNSNGLKSINSIRELKMSLLEQMIEALSRRKKEMFGQMYNRNTGFTLDMPQLNTGQTIGETSGLYVTQTVNSYFYSEEETTAFVSEGRVKTKDGREISFDISFELSRRFEQKYEVYSESSFTLCDPLVFNFNGDVTELTDQHFLFDLDGDGSEEEIASFGNGSGFLALDKNGDGKINDGTELFGTSSGNGFKDLAQYDTDGNGWIDEDDKVFSDLKIWTKNSNGEDELISLKDAGIGAICLENVNTDFSEKNDDSSLLGMIRRTGIFLYENGNAGTIQHVDFAI